MAARRTRVRTEWHLLIRIAAGLSVGLSLYCPANAAEDATEVRERAHQIYLERGPREALPIYQQALELHRKSGERLGEAITLGLLGNAHKRLGDYATALKFHAQALLMKRELGDALETGKTLSHIGLVYWEMGEYQNAIKHFEDSIQIAQQINHSRLEGSALNNLSLVYDELGDYSKSLAGYQRALELHRTENFERGQSDALANIGGVHLLLGQFRKALESYRQALALDERLGLNPAISSSLGNIGLCYLGLGETDKAIDAFDRALALARAGGLSQEEAYWLRGKGNALINSGRYDLGLELHRQALGLDVMAGSKAELVEALVENGNLLLRLGDLAAAEHSFQRAYALAQDIGLHRGITLSLLALGDIGGYRQRYQQAAANYEQALARAQDVGDQARIVTALNRLAQSYSKLGRFDDARQRATEAIVVARRADIRVLVAWSLFQLAELERISDRAERALQHYGEVRKIVSDDDDPELLWRLEFGMAQALSSEGRKEHAVEGLKRAVDIIENVRGWLKEERYRAGYLENKADVYIKLVQLLLELGEIDAAFAASERLRARNYQALLDRDRPRAGTGAGLIPGVFELRERIITLRNSLSAEQNLPATERREPALRSFSVELALVERAYQDFIDDLRSAQAKSYDPGVPADIPGTEELQARLGKDEAVIEYVVATDDVLVFVLTSDSINAISIDVRQRDIDAKVGLLRELLSVATGDAWRKPARSLADYLIAPVLDEGWLSDVKTLRFAVFSVAAGRGRTGAVPGGRLRCRVPAVRDHAASRR